MFHFRLSALLLTIFLCTCTAVPITSIPKINAIDFRTTDLSKLSAIVKLPKEVRIFDTSVTYFAEIESEGVSKEFKSELVFTKGDAQAQSIISKHNDGEHQMWVYKIPENDIAKLDALRAQANQWKAEHGWAKGNAGFSFDDICYNDPDLEKKYKGNLWVRAEETENYFLLLRNLDISIKSLEAQGAEREQVICSE